jgi:hypothetical protein
MKVYIKMPDKITPYFDRELLLARFFLTSNNLENAWLHLERAHIIGQKYPFEHSLVHWKMLQFGIKIKSVREILGQLPRLLFGGVKSFVGHIPVGNTGGANVPPLKPMKTPTDLAKILN